MITCATFLFFLVTRDKKVVGYIASAAELLLQTQHEFGADIVSQGKTSVATDVAQLYRNALKVVGT